MTVEIFPSAGDFQDSIMSDLSFKTGLQNGSNVAIIKNLLTTAETLRCVRLHQALAIEGDQGWASVRRGCRDNYREIKHNPLSKVDQFCSRSIFFEWNSCIKKITDAVSKITGIKGILEGDGFVEKNDHFFQAAISCYPVGGGMMAPHIDPLDTFFGLHVIVNLSTRGDDFIEGGLKVKSNESDDFIDIEKYWRSGDAIVFNASAVLHSVEPIDAAEPSLGFLRGRYSLSVTMNRFQDIN